MRVSQDRRAPGPNIINQLVAIHGANTRAFGSIDEKGLATHCAKSADRGIYAARNILERLGKKLLGLGTYHDCSYAERRAITRFTEQSTFHAGCPVLCAPAWRASPGCARTSPASS